MADVQVSITTADGKPLAELSKLIEQRSKWLNETAEQSCTATMLDVLVSLRALTTTAKPSKREIVLEETSLVPSFTGGRDNPQFCLRLGQKGSRYTPQNKERVAKLAGIQTKDFKNCKVFRWLDINERHWLIVARSKGEAENWAFDKIKKRAQRFKGLARIALSKLMMKSGSATQ